MKQLNKLLSAFSAKPLMLLSLFALLPTLVSAQSSNIEFADATVKSICVSYFDDNGDGELSYNEAAAVTNLGTIFSKKKITSFNELQYFTGLKGIGSSAFYYCNKLTTITIPNSVTSIERLAFYYCESLTSLTIPNSVTTIGEKAFHNCRRLTNLTIPNSVTVIGNQAFYWCKGLTAVTIPNSVTSIGDNPFASCSNLTSITVESGNPNYDSRDNCNAIFDTNTNTLISGCKKTVIPNFVISIGNNAFDGCTGLTTVTIPNSVTSIGEESFYNCTGLTSVIIPNSVTTLGNDAFAYCTGLTSVTIPISVTNIGDNPFSSCAGLTSIKVESGNTYYDSRNDCNAIIETNTNKLVSGCMNTIIPNSVTTIGILAFDGCTGLISLTIPNSVTTIGKYAFQGCVGLTSLTIPNSVTTIENYAFWACEGLTEVRSMIIEPFEIDPECWQYVNRNEIPLYVPAGTKEKYEATAGWNKFANIVEMGASSGISIDETNFPDENFRNWVLAQDYGQDGVLTETEIAGVTRIYVDNKDIADLKGIGYFTALTDLYCYGNQLTSLDLSQNTALTVLDCYNNQLTSLDLSQNTALTKLQCVNNKLNTLDLSKNTALTSLRCSSNQLTTLDVSENTALTELYCYNNQLTSLDVSRNRELEELDCNNNQLTSLDLSQNTALTALNCHFNQLTSLDVSKNTALTVLNCYNNQLTSLNVSKSTALKELLCYNNQLASLDVSKNKELTTLGCGGNQLTRLDLSQNTALTLLWCDNNQLTTVDVSKNTALTLFRCDYNQLTSLDVSKNTALDYLGCNNNQLTSLDVSKNTALMTLDCFDNQLTSLNVSQNTALTGLLCNNNQLTSLDVSKNTALDYLGCNNNKIRGEAMDVLIAGLPGTGGRFYAISPNDNNEQNVVTMAQVTAAKEKGWTTYYYDNSWKEYEGSEQGMDPIGNGETIDIGNEIDENTNLEGTVVDNVFVNISNGNGGFDPAEGCLIVSKPTDDSAINGKDIFGDDFKDNYTGIVFKVNEGKGSIKVEAETQGNMVLKVKIGNSEPIEMELDGKLKVKFPYNVSEETLVYIYGGLSDAGAKATGARRAPSATDLLKIYGFEIVSDPSGIGAIENGNQPDAPVYNLNGQRVNTPGKGVYIKNGRKVLMK